MIKRKFHPIVPHDKLRLHSAERNSSWGKVFKDYKKSLTEEDIKFYPNVNKLKPALTEFYGYEHFLMGFGSDRCIKYFFEANSNRHWFWGKKRLVVTEPSFPMYDVYGQMHDTKIVKVPYHVIKFPILEFLDKITSNSIVVLSNPSSPIGDVICREDLIKILDIGQPTLVDEAYIEFSDEESCIDLIDKYPNLYVTRTLSKAYGSAGTRFGCVFSQKQNIEKMIQFRDMYEITGQTYKWVETLIKNKEIADEYIESVKSVRGKLMVDLYNKGIMSIPSQANWLHIKESDLPPLPEDIIFRKNCIIPDRGDEWVRLCITDSLKDYKWILK